MTERLYKGVAASPGIAVGPIVFLSRRTALPSARSGLTPQAEWERFEEAVSRLDIHMRELQGQIPTAFSDESLEIFSVYQALVEDPVIVKEIRAQIFDGASTAEWAVYRAFQSALEVLARVPHGHIAEKCDDLETVRELLLEILAGRDSGGKQRFSGCIVVCSRLTPRDILDLARDRAAGVVSETGTRGSHVAILARNLAIPTVLGVGDCRAHVCVGETAVLDGNRGLFEVAPSEAHLSVFQIQNQAWQAYGNEVMARAALPVHSAEGVELEVLANIESSQEIPDLKARGASGVGLFRLEFFYLARAHVPGEDEIRTELEALGEALPAGEVVVRLLDAGGDKDIPSLGVVSGGAGAPANPAMGLRGVRMLLHRPEVLGSQVRAILRANCRNGNISLLIPFVSCLEEVRAVRSLVREEWRLMSTAEEVAPPFPRIGMMVELPSAVAAIDLFAREVDFFSVGTNDLTQHLLAVDRTDETVSVLYDSFHPAMLRSLKMIFEESLARQLPVTLCGEMAGDPLALELLVGLGLRSFSVNTHAIPFVKDILREISLADATALATEIRLLRTPQEVRGRLQARFIEKFGLERYAMMCSSH